MGVRLLTVAVLALLLVPAANAADTTWLREAHGARAALTRSVKAGYLSHGDEARYLGVLAHARAVRNRVPPLRAQLLDAVLRQVASRRSPTAPRALVLYGTLAENADYLADHRVPRASIDAVGAGGIVYRFFSGSGLQFHPLANAGQLNALIAKGDMAGARALAAGLAARVVPQPNGSAAWEYEFNFGNERAPWRSGLAQAVMAQAFARVGEPLLARRAYRAIPGSLDRRLPAGPWVRLYSGRRDVVLNAQLQSAISIADYAQLTGDAHAAAYANRLLRAAKTMLPRFDTGHWSRYELGVDSNLHYQDYVITLLKLLATRTADPVWGDEAQRLELYETEPPLLTGPSVTRVVYPRPKDGVRDALVVRFWLSKISKVVLVVDGKAVDGYTWIGGWHTFRYTPSGLSPGIYPVRLVASSLDGNPGATDLGSFSVMRDTIPPTFAAAKAHGRVFWNAKDGESACCRIQLELQRGGQHKSIAVPRSRGSATVPPGYWVVTAIAHDAAGNRAVRKLGLVVGSPKR
jgi:hypothetical protein